MKLLLLLILLLFLSLQRDRPATERDVHSCQVVCLQLRDQQHCYAVCHVPDSHTQSSICLVLNKVQQLFIVCVTAYDHHYRSSLARCLIYAQPFRHTALQQTTTP